MRITSNEAIAIKKALARKQWQTIPISPLIREMLENLPGGQEFPFLQVLGPEIAKQIMEADGDIDPAFLSENINSDIPDLPKGVRLTAQQEKQGRQSGKLLDAYVDWASQSANQTPMLFHIWGGLFIMGTTIARRLCVHTPWQQRIYPNLYVINVALSTYHRKSAGMSLAEKILRNSTPHLLMPNPGSPEGFITLLSGNLPDVEKMSPAKRQHVLKGATFAASRALLREEISGLFKSMGSDYMRGMKEHVMQAYDAPDQMEFFNNSRGLAIIQRVGLSLFGVTTYAELANSITVSDWYNGHLARFALMTPEPDFKDRPPLQAPIDPGDILKGLYRLNEMLPQPPALEALGGDDIPGVEAWTLVCKCWSQVEAYSQALREMTSPTSSLDDRLRPIYGRLHVMGMKLAIIFAALDWAEAGDTSIHPVIEVQHWYKAQSMVEEARASAHRLLSEVSRNTDTLVEERIGATLARHPEGLTLRDLTRNTGFSRKAIQEAISSLEDAGVIETYEYKNPKGGKGTHRYRNTGS